MDHQPPPAPHCGLQLGPDGRTGCGLAPLEEAFVSSYLNAPSGSDLVQQNPAPEQTWDPANDLAGLNFEQKVLAFLNAPAEVELRLDGLFEDDEKLLTKIAREQRLCIRLGPSQYSSIHSHPLREAVISRPPVAFGRQDGTPSAGSHNLPSRDLFHGFGSLPWAPTAGWECSSGPSLAECYSPPDPSLLTHPFPRAVGLNHWGSRPLVSSPGVLPGPGSDNLPSLHGLGSVATPLPSHQGQTLRHLGGTETLRQPNIPSTNRSLPREPRSSTPSSAGFSGSLLQRIWVYSSRDMEEVGGVCWRCKLMHKRCDPGSPCHRCAALPGNPTIRCRRGPVWDWSQLPVLCPLPTQHERWRSSPASPSELPPALLPASMALRDARRRQMEDVGRIKRFEPCAAAERNRGILVNVVTIKVDNIRDYNPIPEMLSKRDFPYDELIIRIVWELIDNQDTAQLMGIEVVDDLVAFLEAASLCEAKSGHPDPKRRLVYCSMCCLVDCAEALRLSLLGLLTADAHSSCSANGCISPGLRGLSKHIPRYVKALTSALFSKKRSENCSWLLIFYSLCIQGYVRRALMSLEGWGRSMCIGIENSTGMLGSATYLHTAASLFRQISAQNGGKLANKIRNSRARPSVYLGAASQSGSSGQVPPHQTARASSSWEKWHEEGINGYLRRIFQIADDTIRPDTNLPGDDSDSDVTIRSPTARASSHQDQEGNDSPHNTSSWMIPVCAENIPAPSIFSQWSATSIGDSSASFAESVNPSMLSLSTMGGSSVYGIPDLDRATSYSG
ncbi:hypothetical protein MFIFM68171_07015 [Madurella fahalii]|uniref:Zn(2)-C6 fungal-type domain-containing protein n=1 Tax=Madurella fahalii TaxID=1157608 RepID=A0ABQ0GGB3_9PEZI